MFRTRGIRLRFVAILRCGGRFGLPHMTADAAHFVIGGTPDFGRRFFRFRECSIIAKRRFIARCRHELARIDRVWLCWFVVLGDDDQRR